MTALDVIQSNNAPGNKNRSAMLNNFGNRVADRENSRSVKCQGKAVLRHGPVLDHTLWQWMPGTVCHYPLNKSTLRWEPVKLTILTDLN